MSALPSSKKRKIAKLLPHWPKAAVLLVSILLSFAVSVPKAQACAPPLTPICVVAGALLMAGTAYFGARTVVGFAWGKVLDALLEIAGAITTFLTWLISLEVSLIGVAIDPNTWGGFIENPLVKTGWQIVRDFVNMGFVIAIIVIAIGFILRLQTYGSSKILWRLIIAAILVNFSLVIAGLFLDSANIIISFFMDFIREETRGSGGIAQTFNQMIDIPYLLASLTIRDQSTLLLQALATNFFLFIALIVMGAAAIMLFIRVVYIWFLLILAPGAWLMWIFPSLERYWREWWGKFLRWAYFAPILLFFVFLALTLLSETRNAEYRRIIIDAINQQAANVAGSTTNNPVTIFANVKSTIAGGAQSFAEWLMRFILFIGLLIGGLVAANGMAIRGANVGLQLASNAANWPVRYVQHKARRVGATTGEYARGLYERGAGAAWQRAGTAMQRVPGLRRIGDVLQRKGLDMQAAVYGRMAEGLEKQKKALESFENDELVNRVRRFRDVAAGLLLADRGTFGDLTDDELSPVLAVARRINRGRKITDVRPSLAARPYTPNAPANRYDAVRNYVSRMDVDRLMLMEARSWADPAVLAGITVDQVRYVRERISTRKRQEILNAVGAMPPPSGAALTTYFEIITTF